MIIIGYFIYQLLLVIVEFLVNLYTLSLLLSANIIVAGDKMLGTWVIVPPALSWAIVGCIVSTLIHFAVHESRKLSRPAVKPFLIGVSCALVIATSIVGPYSIALYERKDFATLLNVLGVAPNIFQGVQPSAEDGSGIILFSKTVQVPATTLWTASGVRVEKGQIFRITADGSVNGGARGDPSWKWVGPEGWGYIPSYATRRVHLLPEGKSFMALIGKIGERGRPFYIGKSYEGKAERSGTLYLGANDVIKDERGYRHEAGDAWWLDNEGSFGVGIQVIGSAKMIEVNSKRVWTETGITLTKGDKVEIRASGKVTWDPALSSIGISGPDGGSWTPRQVSRPDQFPAPDLPIASLIGKVGKGKPFLVGDRVTFTADRNGELYLGLNDRQAPGAFEDNSGSFTASIIINRATSGTQQQVAATQVSNGKSVRESESLKPSEDLMHAVPEKGNLAGEVVKIEMEMVGIRIPGDKIHWIHIDPITTKKTGKLKVGSWIEADVNSQGHANWISASQGGQSQATHKIDRHSLPRIKVKSAIYGKNCGANYNVKRVEAECNGKQTCSGVISNAYAGRDPAFGCAKDFTITYTCGSEVKTAYVPAQVNEGGLWELSCPVPNETREPTGSSSDRQKIIYSPTSTSDPLIPQSTEQLDQPSQVVPEKPSEPKLQDKVVSIDPRMFLNGVWEGTVYQPGFGSYSVIMNIGSTDTSRQDGVIDYPTLKCGGKIEYLRSQDTTVEFQEVISYGKPKCVNGGKIRMKMAGDHSMDWKWYYPDGHLGAEANLRKR
jgi:hypothetical protein